MRMGTFYIHYALVYFEYISWFYYCFSITIYCSSYYYYRKSIPWNVYATMPFWCVYNGIFWIIYAVWIALFSDLFVEEENEIIRNMFTISQKETQYLEFYLSRVWDVLIASIYFQKTFLAVLAGRFGHKPTD